MFIMKKKSVKLLSVFIALSVLSCSDSGSSTANNASTSLNTQPTPAKQSPQTAVTQAPAQQNSSPSAQAPKQQPVPPGAPTSQNPFMIEEPNLKNCLISIFGEKRYTELRMTQPTQQEVAMLGPCMPLMQTVMPNGAMSANRNAPPGIATPPPGNMPAGAMPNQDFQKYVDMIKKDPTVCYTATGMLAEVCKMGPAPPPNTGHGAPPPNAGHNNQPLGPPTAKPNEKLESETQAALGSPIDPNNPPKIAIYNFIDLQPFVSISKIRSITGHMYSGGDSEYDVTGKSCRSMKHYFESYTKDQRWNSSFGSYNTKGNVKFYAPADGTLTDVVTASAEGGTEYQFRIESSLYPRIGFSFHHIDLLPELRNGAEVSAGQFLGTMYRNNGQGEIATYIETGAERGDSGDYISFFDVMSDDVFALYQAKGIQSRSQMTIPLAEREANPIGCTLGDGKGGKFIANGDEFAFAKWQDGPDNWVFMTN